MNRHDRRARAAMSRRLAPTRPARLTRMPDEEIRARWGDRPGDPPVEVWVSQEFLVQVYTIRAHEGQAPALRLSVCRTTAGTDGRWHDGITWDDLQRVKREIGRGDAYAIEVYPRDCDVVNVANMRHLWLFEQPLDAGWFNRPAS